MTKKTIIGVVAVIILALAAVVVFPSSSERFGGVTNFDGLQVGSDGFRLSTTGTTLTKIISGTFTNTSCSGAATQAAFATTTYSCTVTGAAAGDAVFVTLASSTSHGVVLQSAHASSTASDNIRVIMYNSSTTAGVASTTNGSYLIVK